MRFATFLRHPKIMSSLRVSFKLHQNSDFITVGFNICLISLLCNSTLNNGVIQCYKYPLGLEVFHPAFSCEFLFNSSMYRTRSCLEN